jgi:diketogulonate reductase-like aldo/keto reductase
MRQAPLVPANGANIPAIGLGTFGLSGRACEDAVLWALEAGYRHVDTAAMYGNEEAVGSGLRASGLPRHEVFVTTKVWLDEIAPGRLESAAEASLKRLGLDAVDLLLIHWPNAAVPVRDSTAALCRAKRTGLAHHVGVSNYTAAMLDETVSAANEPIAVNQVEYHPYLDQTRVKRACARHGVALTAYCPLGRSGLFGDPMLREIAKAKGRSVSQTVMRWHIQQPGVAAIPKSGAKAHIRENLDVFDFELGVDEMGRISALARPDGRVVDPPFAPAWDAPA